MTRREITLEVAEYLDSDDSRASSVPREEAREVLHRFLECAYERVAKAPQHLDGEDLSAILRDHLPRHFRRREPLAQQVSDTLESYLDDLETRHTVVHSFELRQALAMNASAFLSAVEIGSADPASVAPSEQIVGRGSKVGRNDPCPCGSGKKFKKCCGRG